ncbi:Gfo/Idh/MocA family protein [Pseudaestuariivita sp.]|uniref:Gfo/Idh/MocA family protein n=1 Tax=Pseudaestuariivita sp. TaxID=2211669 RepID=UPI0040598930
MKLALIGTGMVAGTYADALRALPELLLTRVSARRMESAVAFAAEHADLGAQASTVEEIASDAEIGAVLLTTPPDARLGIVTLLAKAEKPILMEKPVERSLEAASELVALCEAAGVPLGITFQHRARQVVQDLRARLTALGPLRAVEVAVPWWRPQSYYDAPGRGTYARDGGGVLITQAIHQLDLMLSLTGPVAAVQALSATTGFHAMEAEDFVAAGLVFESGAVGHLFASTASFPGRGETLTLHGAHGSAHLAAGTLQIDWQDGRSETVGQQTASGAGADPMAFTSDWHGAMIADFAASLRDGRPPMVPGREALKVHALIDALETSARTGQRADVSKV